MRRLARGLRHCLREAWEGLSRNPALSLLSVVAIGISLYVLGLFLVVAVNLNRFVDALGRDVQVQIFLRDGASPAALRALRIALDADPAVEAARMVSAEEARRRFRDVFPTLADLSDGIGGDPFPASFDLTLRDGYRDPATVERVARSYEGVPGVEEVRFDLEWMERLAGIVALVRGGGVGIGLLLGLAMMVTIGAVIRLTVLARREEIEIMRLVGATGAFVRGPFLLAAAAQGTAGGRAGARRPPADPPDDPGVGDRTGEPVRGDRRGPLPAGRGGRPPRGGGSAPGPRVGHARAASHRGALIPVVAGGCRGDRARRPIRRSGAGPR
ncbi:MAG: cell division protein FtsX [Acidobacteriota bacterium]